MRADGEIGENFLLVKISAYTVFSYCNRQFGRLFTYWSKTISMKTSITRGQPEQMLQELVQ